MTLQLSLLRLRIAEYYEEVRRAVDLDVETLIVAKQDNQMLIDQLNWRRDSQIEFLKQEEDEALKRVEQASRNGSNPNELEIIKWCYFTINVANKICLIRTDVRLSPKQILMYRQFLTYTQTRGEYPESEMNKLLETFGVTFHHLVIWDRCFFTRVVDDRTVITLDSSSLPLFKITRIRVYITLSISSIYRMIEEFIDSPSARFILKHVQRVIYFIEFDQYFPKDIRHCFYNVLNTLIQLDKLFDSFRQQVYCNEAPNDAPTILLIIRRGKYFSPEESQDSVDKNINLPSLPDYKYQVVWKIDSFVTETELGLLSYLYGNMDNLQELSIEFLATSSMLQPLIWPCRDYSHTTKIYVEFKFCKVQNIQEATYRLDIHNALSSIKDSIIRLKIRSYNKNVNLELENTKSLTDFARIEGIELLFQEDIRTDFFGQEQTVLSFEGLQNMASYWKGCQSASNPQHITRNNFSLSIDRSGVVNQSE